MWNLKRYASRRPAGQASHMKETILLVVVTIWRFSYYLESWTGSNSYRTGELLYCKLIGFFFSEVTLRHILQLWMCFSWYTPTSEYTASYYLIIVHLIYLQETHNIKEWYIILKSATFHHVHVDITFWYGFVTITFVSLIRDF